MGPVQFRISYYGYGLCWVNVTNITSSPIRNIVEYLEFEQFYMSASLLFEWWVNRLSSMDFRSSCRTCSINSYFVPFVGDFPCCSLSLALAISLCLLYGLFFTVAETWRTRKQVRALEESARTANCQRFVYNMS